jgi:hypothetical protein
MKHLFAALVFLSFTSHAQDGEPATIRVRKESNLAKIVLDNSAHRLFVVDRFGNPRDNEILGYMLTVKAKRETRNFQGYSNALTGEMINYLNRQKSSVKIFFTRITAKDERGHPVKLPDMIDVWFPDCGNCGEKRGRSR